MKKIKYFVYYCKLPSAFNPAYKEWDVFQIQMGEPNEWSTHNYCALSQESLTDDELQVYVKQLFSDHGWNEVIRIEEVIESNRDIIYRHEPEFVSARN